MSCSCCGLFGTFRSSFNNSRLTACLNEMVVGSNLLAVSTSVDRRILGKSNQPLRFKPARVPLESVASVSWCIAAHHRQLSGGLFFNFCQSSTVIHIARKVADAPVGQGGMESRTAVMHRLTWATVTNMRPIARDSSQATHLGAAIVRQFAPTVQSNKYST